MRRISTPTRRAIVPAVVAAVLAAMPMSGSHADEADAKAILKAMSDYLAAQQTISFGYDATLEVVTKEDQKLGLASSGTVTMTRPDRIVATRSGGFVNVEVLFDGNTLTLFGKNANMFTQVAIPGSIDNLVDELRDKYGRPLPAADLLMTDPYSELMSEVTDVKDLGSGVVGGVECDSLAFRTKEVDWQIWIAHGDRPYPCRYVITTRQMSRAPQYTIQVRDWKTGTEVATVDYAFTNTTGAKQIEIEKLRETVRELPENFMTGANQ